MSKLTKDDKMVWRYATRGVKKTAHVPEPEEIAAPEMPRPSSEKLPVSHRPLPARSKKPMRQPLLEGEVNYLDGNRFEKLRKGKIRAEAKIDLHGLGLNEAKITVYEFIRAAHMHHFRCVQIITGKSGIIKKEFPLWMNIPEIASVVLSFTTATPRDGGSGAYYLMLKK